MDARDIIEEPKVIKDGLYLEEIYDLQKELLNHYIKIEGIQPYPIDVNIKKSQILLKDFTGRVTEELAEGYEAFKSVLDLTLANQMWFGGVDKKTYTMALNHLQNANEEQADALHFLVELMIYANIQPGDIMAYIQKGWVEEIANNGAFADIDIIETDIIKACQIVGSVILSEENNFAKIEYANLVDILRPLEREEVVINMDTRFLQGGRLVNPELYQNHKLIIHDINYHLNIARNYLKNKPWKQSEILTNEEQYQEQLVLAFINFMGYLQYLGLDSEQVYFLYFKKNMVNKFRISSKY